MSRTITQSLRQGAFLLAMAAIFAGCSSTYYAAMEKFGYHKRDILVSRVEKAKDSQEEATEVFADALEEFSATVEFDGGELESRYNRFKDKYEDSAESATEVRERITAIEKVADALFVEWQEELNSYSNPRLRESSQNQLSETKGRYTELMSAMNRAESKIEPVLSALNDQVLYLKHNLNAQAVASLKSELVHIEGDVATLIAEMKAAIEEANSFLASVE